MRRQRVNIDYSQAVFAELAVTLGELRERTGSFIEIGNVQSQRDLSEIVGTVSRTLSLIECQGGLLLTEELLALLGACAADQVGKDFDAAPVLVMAGEKLVEYVDYLKTGGLDLPLALLPLINDMRACRGEQLLSEALIVSPLFDVRETSDGRVRGENEQRRFFNTVSKVRLPFMQGLLAWFKEPHDDSERAVLIDLLDELEQASPSAALQDLWLAARAVCVSVLDGSLQNNAALKMLLGQLERYVGHLVEVQGRGAKELNLPAGLFKNLLYYVALSRSTDDRVVRLQRQYRLHELLPPRVAMESAREALGGPNAQLADAICASLADELSEIKSLAARLDNEPPNRDLLHEVVNKASQRLHQLASTFLLLGVARAEALCQSAQQQLSNFENSPQQPYLDHLASDIVGLEALLDELRHSGTRLLIFADSFERDMLEQRRLSAYQYDQIVERCLAEARKVMSSVESSYLSSLVTSEPEPSLLVGTSSIEARELAGFRARGKLDGAAKLLDGVKSALQILPLPEVVPLLNGAVDYLQRYAQSRQPVETQAHDAFADLMVTTRLYLDTDIQRQGTASDLLSSAELALDQLQNPFFAATVEENDQYDGFDDETSVLLVSAESDSTQLIDTTLATSAIRELDETINDDSGTGTSWSEVDGAMLGIFTEEALEQFRHINEALARWQSEQDVSALVDLKRGYHTLKGSGRVAGALQISDFAAANEVLLDSAVGALSKPALATDGKLPALPPRINLLLQESAAQLPQLIHDLHDRQSQSERSQGESVMEIDDNLNRRLLDAASDLRETLETELADSTLSDQAPTLANLAHEFEANRTVAERDVAGFIDNDEATWAEQQYQAQTLSLGDVADELAQTSVVGNNPVSDTPTEVIADADSDARSPDLDSTMQLESIESSLDLPEQELSQSFNLSMDESIGYPLADTLGETMVDKVDEQHTSVVLPLAGNQKRTSAGVRTRAGEDIDATLYRVFDSEARSHLRTLRYALDEGNEGDELPNELMTRTLHTLHGSARAAGISDIADLVAPLEDVSAIKGRHHETLSVGDREKFSDVIAAMENTLDALSRNEVPSDQLSAKQMELPAWVSSIAAQNPPPTHTQTDLVEVFVDEAGTLLFEIQKNVDELKNGADQSTTLQHILRPLHTLKGSARVAGCTAIADLAHALESALLRWRESDRGADAVRQELLQESVDALMINREQAVNGASLGHFDLLIAELGKDLTLSAGSAAVKNTSAEAVQAANFDDDDTLSLASDNETFEHTLVENELTDETGTSLIGDSPELDSTVELASGVIQVRSGGLESTIVDSIAGSTNRQENAQPRSFQPGMPQPADVGLAEDSNTPGASEQVRLDSALIGRLAEVATDVSVRQAQLSSELLGFRDTLLDLEKTTARLRLKLRELDLETDMSPRSSDTVGNTPDEHSRLDSTDVNTARDTRENKSAIEDSRQLSEVMSDLDNIRDTLQGRLRASEESLAGTIRRGSDLHESLLRSRLVRFDQHRQRLISVVRQTAGALKKQATLTITGGEHCIDRNMHKDLIAPLEHLIRNSIAHGIETPDNRRLQGKPVTGSISVNVSVDGTDLCVEVSDDGAGVDLDAVQRRLTETSGDTLPSTRQPAQRRELLDALFKPGLTTATQTDQYSGRGIGLDSTLRSVEEIGGRVHIDSYDGQGTTVTLRIAQRVVINQVVLVEHGDSLFGIPVNHVRQVHAESQSHGDGQKSENHGLVQFDGEQYEPMAFDRLFGSSNTVGSRRPELDNSDRQVLVEVNNQRWALEPEAVLGYRELIAKPPARQLASLGVYSGASVLSDGRVVLILDMNRLHESALRPMPTAASRDRLNMTQSSLTQAAGQNVLVVDDSVTMRTYTGRIVEQAGLHCLSARDGLEALDAINANIPDLLLLDIEMPRMDGFELLQELQKNPVHAAIPVIMISSRTSSANQLRAKEFGVEHYLGKPYDADELLELLEDRFALV